MALILLLSISSLAVGASQVFCPNHTITAVKGRDVTLSAEVRPPVNLSDERVDVTRSDSEERVHSYRHGRDHLELQSAGFKNRTSLDRDALSRGVITLTVSSLTPADSGRYSFYVPLDRRCDVNLTVVKDASTRRPPEEETPEPNTPEAARKEPLWKTFLPSVIGVLAFVSAAVAVGIYLWKPENRKSLMSRLKGTRRQEARPELNQHELENLQSRLTEGDGEQHDPEENELRECVILDNHHPSP